METIIHIEHPLIDTCQSQGRITVADTELGVQFTPVHFTEFVLIGDTASVSESDTDGVVIDLCLHGRGAQGQEQDKQCFPHKGLFAKKSNSPYAAKAGLGKTELPGRKGGHQKCRR